MWILPTRGPPSLKRKQSIQRTSLSDEVKVKGGNAGRCHPSCPAPAQKPTAVRERKVSDQKYTDTMLGIPKKLLCYMLLIMSRVSCELLSAQPSWFQLVVAVLQWLWDLTYV